MKSAKLILLSLLMMLCIPIVLAEVNTTLNYPPNLYQTTGTSVFFNWTPTSDNLNLSVNITSYLMITTSGNESNLVINQTLTNCWNISSYTENASYCNISVSGFTPGFYLWNVTSSDLDGNLSSPNRWIEIQSTAPTGNLSYFRWWNNSGWEAMRLHKDTGDLVVSGNINASGMNLTTDLNVHGNLTLGQKITFALGEMIDNIADGWLRFTGNVNVTGDLHVTDNAVFHKNITVSNVNSSLKPGINNTYDLGNEGNFWRLLYVHAINLIAQLNDTQISDDITANATKLIEKQSLNFTHWHSYHNISDLGEYNDTLVAHILEEDQHFNRSQTNYTDTMDLANNNSLMDYIAQANSSLKDYVDEQDNHFNRSQTNYTDTLITGLTIVEANITDYGANSTQDFSGYINATIGIYNDSVEAWIAYVNATQNAWWNYNNNSLAAFINTFVKNETHAKLSYLNMSGGNITSVDRIYANNLSGSISWSNLTNYPLGCPSGAITQLGDSVTCTDSWVDVAGDDITGNINFTNHNLTNVSNIMGSGSYVTIGDAGVSTHSLSADDDLFVSGNLEVDGMSYFDQAALFSTGYARWNDNIEVRWGTSTDAVMAWETADADANYLNLILGQSGGGSNNFVISAAEDIDWGHARQLDPTIFMHGNDSTDTSEWLSFAYLNATDEGKIATGKGNLSLQPAGQRVVIGATATQTNLTMYSPDGTAWNCGPGDDGVWSCQ